MKQCIGKERDNKREKEKKAYAEVQYSTTGPPPPQKKN